MKVLRLLLVSAVIGFQVGRAAIVVPGGDGSDGALNITVDTVIDLSLATTAAWDTAGTGNGVYDADKWAVVFKYTSVNIDPGVTLSFTNHGSRAPVVWLVNGDVTINGTLDLNGQNRVTAPNLSEPGPGGFRGGTHYYTPGIGASAGFGVGGGGTQVAENGYGGSYGTVGSAGTAAYGNPSLIPLIGGSGGGGGLESDTGGGAGGGAIFIACTQTLNINGAIVANGGAGRSGFPRDSGGGAGGGIRLTCDTLAGEGTISAIGGSGAYPGGLGRIRIERVTNDNTIAPPTPDPSVLGLTAGDTALIWPPAGAPQVKIVSIGGVTVPDDPRASFGTQGADTVLPETTTTTVVIETTNVEASSQVKVRLTPRSNANYTEVDAVRDETVTDDPFRWTADVPVNVGYSAVQVKVVRP